MASHLTRCQVSLNSVFEHVDMSSSPVTVRCPCTVCLVSQIHTLIMMVFRPFHWVSHAPKGAKRIKKERLRETIRDPKVAVPTSISLTFKFENCQGSVNGALFELAISYFSAQASLMCIETGI
ncbi:hypothetical protein ARMGADRAFT_585623 [Armillaria gallica]|uniref:Uncharacterized protein n=1 Tax=Armillaria gallica TaxID=47427 RepID=A0A2H3EDX6_ARMGA|nr:hypothetical protein ARMGADRAFT_585623 [Armillaria gallica]